MFKTLIEKAQIWYQTYQLRKALSGLTPAQKEIVLDKMGKLVGNMDRIETKEILHQKVQELVDLVAMFARGTVGTK